MGAPHTPAGAGILQFVAMAARRANRVGRFADIRPLKSAPKTATSARRLHRRRESWRHALPCRRAAWNACTSSTASAPDGRTSPPGNSRVFRLYTVDQMRLQPDNHGPRHEQLARSSRQAICSGQLLSGNELPSGRMLSGNLGLSRNTALRAYEQRRIERRGVMREGWGTHVRDVPLSRGTHQVIPSTWKNAVPSGSGSRSKVTSAPPFGAAGRDERRVGCSAATGSPVREGACARRCSRPSRISRSIGLSTGLRLVAWPLAARRPARVTTVRSEPRLPRRAPGAIFNVRQPHSA